MDQDKIVNWFDGLSYDEQRQFMTKLGKVAKLPPAYLKIDATNLTQVAQALKYCRLHLVPYAVEKRGKKVVFCFEGMGLRNQVWFGMQTL